MVSLIFIPHFPLLTISTHSLGAILYVENSLNYRGFIPVNNSIIFHYPASCSGCVVDFFCFSNSTLSGVGEVVLPDGSILWNGTSFNGNITVERLPFSTLRVQVPISSNLTFRMSHNGGIFTCRLPDTNGDIQERSIGVYTESVG